MLVGSIVGCHHGHHLLGWLLHHLHVRSIWWVLLSDMIHHALAGLLRQHGHGRAHTVRATARLHRALDGVVCHWWALLWALLLLGATGGRWSTAASQGKDGLVHSGDQSAHDVGAGRVWVVRWALIPARCARVSVIDVATVGTAVVPILPTLVGSGGHMGCCAPAPLLPNQAGCCGKLPPPLPPPVPPLTWPPPLHLSRGLLNVCCCCGGA